MFFGSLHQDYKHIIVKVMLTSVLGLPCIILQLYKIYNSNITKLSQDAPIFNL